MDQKEFNKHQLRKYNQTAEARKLNGEMSEREKVWREIYRRRNKRLNKEALSVLKGIAAYVVFFGGIILLVQHFCK